MDFSLPPELNIPATVGPFRVVKMLGHGGTGVVYLGERMEHFSQRVAIKFLNLTASDEESATGLALEEQVLTALDHPGIVRFLDKGGGRPGHRYIVMEYVDGTPLDTFCDDRRLSVEARIRLLIQVMDAIGYAHRHFVIHADLKPSNILVTSEGQPKLLDFGIATMLTKEQQQADKVSTDLPHYTPAFASPEQRRGKRITPASDTYSMAVVAGIVLAGVPPASIDGFVSPVQAYENLDQEKQIEVAGLRATSVTGLENSLEGDLELILAKALRAEPDKRYLSADEFANDLRAFLEYRPISARQGSSLYKARKWMQRHRVAALVGLLFLIVAGLSIFGVVIQTARAAHQRSVAQKNLHDLVRLTGLLDGELYSSVESLAKAEQAKEVLLQGANTTLDELAENSQRDPVLEIELARQYGTLARLHLGVEGPNKDKHRREAISDLDRADALLKRLPVTDDKVVAMRQQMLSLRQTVSGQ